MVFTEVSHGFTELWTRFTELWDPFLLNYGPPTDHLTYPSPKPRFSHNLLQNALKVVR